MNYSVLLFFEHIRTSKSATIYNKVVGNTPNKMPSGRIPDKLINNRKR